MQKAPTGIKIGKRHHYKITALKKAHSFHPSGPLFYNALFPLHMLRLLHTMFSFEVCVLFIFPLSHSKCIRNTLRAKSKMTRCDDLGGICPVFTSMVPLYHGSLIRQCFVLLWPLRTLKCLHCGAKVAVYFFRFGGTTLKKALEVSSKAKR